MNLKNCAVGIAVSASFILPLYAQQKGVEPNTRIFLDNDNYIDGYIDSDEMANWKSKKVLTLKNKDGEFTVRTSEIKSFGKPSDTLANKIDRIRLKNDSVIEGIKYYEDENTICLKISGGEMFINKSDIYGSEIIEQKKASPPPAKKASEGIELIPHKNKDAEPFWPPDDWPTNKKIALLIKRLESTDDATVYGRGNEIGAIQRLTQIGEPAVPFLAEKLDASKRELSAEICVTLINIKAPDTINYVKKYLSDSNPVMRKQVVVALGAIGNTDDSQYIRPLLKDKDANVRLAAIDAIINLKDTDSLVDLASLITDKDRAVSAKALLNFPTLYGLDKDKDSIRDAMDALGDLADSKDDEVRKNIANLLGKIKSEEAIKKLQELLQDDSKYVRAEAALALGSIGLPEAIHSLIEKLKTEDQISVKVAILKALKLAQSTDAIPTIIAVMKTSDTETSNACWLTLKAITNMQLDNDPSAWEKWWNEVHEGRNAQNSGQ